MAINNPSLFSDTTDRWRQENDWKRIYNNAAHV